MRYSILIIYSLIVVGCSQRPSSKAEEVNGKYVQNIDHYTINFEDGTTYDMNEKDTEKIYYLIRHAEKDSLPKGDPTLSEAGFDRSNRIAEIFQNTQLEAIFSTMTTRTLFTVDSIADLKKMTILPYETRDFKEINESINNSLNTHRVLVVGHANTTPVLANHLYGEQYYTSTFDESDYDNLIVILESNNNKKTILPLKFK
jgi:broad specificity phosphatase PhoE